MSQARERILARIRAACSAAPPARRDAAPVLPPLAGTPVDAFRAAAEGVDATVVDVADRHAVPAAIAAALPAPPDDIAVICNGYDSADFVAAGLRPVDGIAPVAVGDGFAGIAETGSVVCLSADLSLRQAFLADHLFLAVRRSTIVASQEQVWVSLSKRFGARPPRGVVLMTGPSRTADVEQTIQLGAHGPRQLTVLVVGD